MSDTSHEKLSSLVDDELDGHQSLRILEKLKREPELAEKYERYQLIGQLMKQNQAIKISSSFSDAIHDRLRDEPTYLRKAPSRQRQIHWQNTAMASAACLLLAVFWLAPRNDKPMQDGMTVAQNLQTVEHVNPKLNDYLQAHDNAMYAGQMDNNRPHKVRVVHY